MQKTARTYNSKYRHGAQVQTQAQTQAQVSRQGMSYFEDYSAPSSFSRGSANRAYTGASGRFASGDNRAHGSASGRFASGDSRAYADASGRFASGGSRAYAAGSSRGYASSTAYAAGSSRSHAGSTAYVAAASSTAYSNAAPKLKQQPALRPDVVVIPGGAKNNPQFQTLSERSTFIFKMLIAAAVVFAIICSARVWLSTSTVQALENVETLQASVSDARSAGNELEIEHSTLTNPTRIQSEAKSIGMSYANDVERISVTLPASIKTYKDGSISLSDTISSIETQLASS